MKKHPLIALDFIIFWAFCHFLIKKIISYKNHQITNQIINTTSTAKVIIQVIDEFSNKPIDNATVCILETKHYENTNKHGLTNSIEVPIIRNSNFDLHLKRTWGELTILVYKNGYYDNISFYNNVYPNSTRVGLTIKLREIIYPEENNTIITTELPNKQWCETLIKLYKKQI